VRPSALPPSAGVEAAPGSASAAGPPPARSAIVTSLAIGGLAVIAAALFVPATVNGDGLGYLRAAPAGALAPGHLGYLPLLRALARLVGASTPLGLLAPARALSLASAGLAAASLHDVARRVLPPHAGRAALLAALGMAASFGALQAGSDVETYGPALAAVCLAVDCAVRRRHGGGAIWLAACAAAVALAALLHVENVVFAPAAALAACGAGRADPLRRARPADAIVVLLGGGALVLACYLGAFLGRGDDAAGALRFLLGAGHGFSYPLHPWTPLAALHGVAKTLVEAPYLLHGGWLRSVAQTAVGLAGAAALAGLAARPARPPALGRPVALAWALPYTLVGVCYFGSDNERWVFLLPLAWLAAAAGASTSPRALRRAAALVGALFAANLVLGVPAARDPSIRQRADRAAALVRDGDLVLSPGHSWDEYIGFYRPVAVEAYPMAYYCGQLGGAAPMRERLALEVAAARRRGARVFIARADEAPDSDGWKELAAFGLRPDDVGSLLPPGRRVPVAAGLEELLPPPRGTN
jgi:hypothetical protein